MEKQYAQEFSFRVEFKKPTENEWTIYKPNEPITRLSEALDQLDKAKEYHYGSGLESWHNFEYRIAEIVSYIHYVEC